MDKNNLNLLSRKQAMQKGLIHYFTGKPCHKGHITYRFVKTGHCADCATERNRSQTKVEYRKKYKALNYDKILLKNRALYAKNCEQYRKYNRSYQLKNASVQRPKNAVRAMQRIASKLQRTPSWLSADDVWMINEIYHLSMLRTKATGVKWEVDHKIPLRGKTVSGLHVPWNLQVITQKHNRSKGNKINGSAIA